MLSLASAFITTMVQVLEVAPVRLSRLQRISCSPSPADDSSQKSCSAGSIGVALPGTSRYRDPTGLEFALVSTVWCTFARYRSTSACGPTPMKIGVFVSIASASSRRVPTSNGRATVLPTSVVNSIGGDTSA